MENEIETEMTWSCELPGSLRYGRFDKGSLLPCEEESPCVWCSMSETDKDAEKQKNRDNLESYRINTFWEGAAALESLKVDGLDAHNSSIDLLTSTYKTIFDSDPEGKNPVQKLMLTEGVREFEDSINVPIRITDTTASKPEYRRNTEDIDVLIRLRGKESGILYNIQVRFKPQRALLLSQCMDEIMVADREHRERISVHGNTDSVDTTLSPLEEFVIATDFVSFHVSMDDHSGGQDHICIEAGAGTLWPGDDLVSLILCLRNDLTTCLEPEMYTLRHQMSQGSSLISFLRGHSQISIQRLLAFNRAFDKVDQLKRGDSASLLVSNEFKEKFSDPSFPENYPAANPLDIFEWAKLQETDDDGGFEGLETLFG